MSAFDEGGDEGGQNGPSGVSVGQGVALAEAAGFLQRFCQSEQSKAAPNVQLMGRLRTEDGRLELAEEILASLTPELVGGDLLGAWLEGGHSPFDPSNFRKAHVEEFGPAKALLRSTDRVANRERGVARAKTAVDKVKRELARVEAELVQAEDELKAVQAYERSIIYWQMAQHFGKVVGPMFAMGPAWTLMRALSAHASADVLDLNCGLMSGEDRELAEAEYIKYREAQTETIMSMLDFFSGDAAFEERLRDAVAAVCRNSSGRRADLEKAGRKDRSKSKRKTEVHPQARVDSDEVVEGLCRAS